MAKTFPANARGAPFVAYASLVAFAAYFAMYAFRKPFAAASFEGEIFGFQTKTLFVIAQIIGYTLSKFLGIRWLSGLADRHLHRMLVGCILAAWTALLLFGAIPSGPGRALALFFNGLPLGLVWGLVVRRLEGRRQSEVLLAGLSVSFIVASGAVKDVGRWLLSEGIAETWMPALVGALFLPVYLIATLLLVRLPPPTDEDIAARVARIPMSKADRRAFLRRFPVALPLLFLLYFVLTAYRDYRDNYALELFDALGYAGDAGLFTRTEIPVAVGVLVALALLGAVRDRRRGMFAMLLTMTVGVVLLAVATWGRQQLGLSGQSWMIACGLGSYLTYVPFGSMLFERMVALSGRAGTAVFAIYIADALGYCGSITFQVLDDRLPTSRLAFFDGMSMALGIGGALLLVLVGWRLALTSDGGTEPTPTNIA